MLRTILRRGFATQDVALARQLFIGRAFAAAVRRALDAAGRKEKRRRSLPAAVALVLLVALSLFRHLSIPAVYWQVFFWTRRGRRGTADVTDEALVHAKQRLGTKAPAFLFQSLADEIDPLPSFHNMRVHGVDGVRLSTQDTRSNEARFGRWTASNGDRTAFPQLLAVALVATETRQVRRVLFERCTASERECVPRLLTGLGESDLVLLDRGFHAVWLFAILLRRSIHFACRASSSYKPRLLKRLGHGDYLVELCARVQRADKSWKRIRLVLRMIEYKIGKRRRVRLLTDLLDHKLIKPIEIAALYRERWECELAYDELKTHLAAPARGTVNLPFRSRNPDGVIQEAYALFTAYNLIRSWIAVSAAASGVTPDQLSFVGTVQVIRTIFAEMQSGVVDPRRIAGVIAKLRNRRPKRPRWYHRVVRVKIIRYPRKRKWHQEQHIDYKTQMRLVNHYPTRKVAA